MSKAAARKFKQQPNPLKEGLIEFIRTYKVLEFVIGCFIGNIVTSKGTVTHHEALALLDRDESFRGFVSRCWRDEDGHNHEWIPCTYISEIIIRALRAENFIYIRLANQMRTLTRNIIFKPRTEDELRADVHRTRTTYALMQGHPGGLKLRQPDTQPLGNILGNLHDGSALFRHSGDFHDAIIAALRKPGTPADMVTGLRQVYVDWCWSGALTHANAPAAIGDIWPYYTLGDGTDVTLWTPGVAAPAMPHADIQAVYNGVLAQFNVWDGVARAPRRTGDYSL
jgi:hypothetical protein